MPCAHGRALTLFAVYVLVGALIGRFGIGTDATVLSTGLALLSAIVPVGSGAMPGMHRILKRMTIASLFFLGSELFFFALPTKPLWVPILAFGHGWSALVEVAILGCLFLKWRIAAFTATTVLLGVFLAYPAATYLLVAATIGVTLALTSSRVTLRLVGGCAAALGGIAVLALSLQPTLFDNIGETYFQAVGKTNNGQFRIALNAEAVERIDESPLFGSGFTGESTVKVPSNIFVEIDGEQLDQLPPHNDLL